MTKKTLVGTVVSKSLKTISVRIERQIKHSLYRKIMKVHKNILCHDEKQEAQIDNIVEIVETRPISKRKSWKLNKILK